MLRARILCGLWIAALLALLCLHWPHLLADFPNHSPWMDDSKYTDEGWYANAAVRYDLSGHWYLAGDFNPAVALPVWPLLLAGVFHFTGVGLAAARATVLLLFALDLLLAWLVIRTVAPAWVALLAVTVLVSNPFLYAFSRLALLEPLLICLLLLSWLLALRWPRSTAALVGIGLLLWIEVLVKTTAVFLVPSTLVLLALPHRREWRAALRPLAIAGSTAAVAWCGWYFLLVWPYFRLDYHYFFEANQRPQPTSLAGWAAAFWYALHGVLWISPALCALTAAILLASLFSLPARRSLWRNPLLIASLTASAGYIFFIGWHNSPQPRYYQVVAYPLSFLLALGIAGLLERGLHLPWRVFGMASAAALCVISCAGTFRILDYQRHPQYTWLHAARGVARTIDQNPGANRLLLSISGDDIALMTHLHAICDDYGTWDLTDRMRLYRPGWYAAWNEIDDDTLADLESQYSLQRVAAFPAFDDPDRNLLILYRLLPLRPAAAGRGDEEQSARNDAPAPR